MRTTKAIIYTQNFVQNLAAIRKTIGIKRKMCVAMKADAYGHGVLGLWRHAEHADAFGFATADEAIEIRNDGCDKQLILFGLPDFSELEQLFKSNIELFIPSLEYATAAENTVKKLINSENQQFACHIKVDTGMNRIGCGIEEVEAIACFIKNSPYLRLKGIATHFPVADSPDLTFTSRQIQIFTNLVKDLEQKGYSFEDIHAANSAAIEQHPDSYFNMVRPGILAYGYGCVPDSKLSRSVKPVMELQTKVSFVKKVNAGQGISYGLSFAPAADSIIATVPVGYADGYMRFLSNKATVLIKDKLYSIAGRICMDQFMINCLQDSDINVGDTAILFGPAQKDGSIPPTAAELAELADTISYEITCAVSKRVPRVYI